MENKNNNNYKNKSNNVKEDGIDQLGLLVHSQVRKIKQQESVNIIDWSPGQPEIRPVLREITRQLSRSPLGISV